MAKAAGDPDTRSAILRVAEAQFGAKGYAGTHLQSIAEEVGVQKTALYYYFDSKEALYAAVLEQMLESFDQVFRGATAQGKLDVATLRTAIEDLNDILAKNPNFSPIVMRIFIDRIDIESNAIAPLISRIIEPMLKFYSAGVAAGIFRDMSARHALLSLIGAATFYYAAGESSSSIVGLDDLYGDDAMAWRRRELSTFVLKGLLPDARQDTETESGDEGD